MATVTTTRGAFLAPALVSMSTCFVNLPRAFVQAFINGPDMTGSGSTILELSWETTDGYVQRVCIGWVGGLTKDAGMRSDVIEMSAEFARCLGIREHLEKFPQAFLGVHVVESIPIARQVNVEPCSADDWELIQLHAGLLEAELLRQICVVNDKQVTPIWVHQNILIRIRISLPIGIEHARLSPNTEVIVAPNERKQKTDETAVNPEFYYEPSPVLVVQDGTNQSPDEVWIHPQTLALLDGALLPNAINDSHEPLVIAIWSTTIIALSEGNDPEQPETTHFGKKCLVARLKCSNSVVRGHVMLNSLMATSLDVSAHSAIQLRVLRFPDHTPLRIALKVDSDLFDGFSSASVSESIRYAFVNWMSTLPEGLVLHSGSMVRFHLDQDVFVEAIVHVEYEQEDRVDEKEVEDFPIGALEKYSVLGGRHGTMIQVQQVDIVTGTDVEKTMLKKLHAKDDVESDMITRAMLELSRKGKPYDQAKAAIRSLIYRDASTSRVLLGTRPPGSSFVHGNRGSGKTTILHALAKELEEDRQCFTYNIFVDCRNLRGLKMESVKGKLKEVFEDASTHAPSVIILDNLDALVPEEEESAGAANEQARRLAELIVILMQQNRDRMWKTTLELHASCKRELAAIKRLQNLQKEAKMELLSTVGAAMAKKSVAIIAASRSDSSIHKTLRCCGLFDRPIQVTSPDAAQRESIIREMLVMKTQSSKHNDILLDPIIDFGLLASLTEGYSLRDLSSATDRTLHQTFARCARQARKSLRCSDSTLKIVQNDFVDGIKGFQPTALIGVDLFKSSVKWSDVGGLLQVRTVLKDTLELPARYGKLYDNAPIKLPAGMLLYGPPGCGKTLLASAVANECGLNFISVKGPEVLNKYIGASEQAIRDLFARAAAAAPSVLFLDEFDSIAPRRGADNTGVTDRLVNQLLTFLDGVEGRKGVYVLAATSRPDMIDPALLRPGRLDKSLYCGFPTEEERLDILRAVAKDMTLDEEAEAYLSVIASAPKSSHFSGADLQAIMSSAQLELVHDKLNAHNESSDVLTKRHVQSAFESAKPSMSESARRQFDSMYAGFSKARNTDFAVATSDATATSATLKSPITHQRTALA